MKWNWLNSAWQRSFRFRLRTSLANCGVNGSRSFENDSELELKGCELSSNSIHQESPLLRSGSNIESFSRIVLLSRLFDSVSKQYSDTWLSARDLETKTFTVPDVSASQTCNRVLYSSKKEAME